MTDTGTEALKAAAAALAEVLQAENTALEAMDLAAAGAMLADKQQALARFAAVAPEPDAAEALPVLAGLRDLAARNRTLLERGMAVQGRLIGMVARAAKEQSAAALPGYGASGATLARAMPAVALAARA